MPMYRPSHLPFRPSLSLVLLATLLVVLWVAGGASRADALGQVVVRGSAWGLLIVAILFGNPPAWREARPVATLLAAALILAILQLVPLPPMLWEALPGRASFLEAANASGQAQPWRPWSIVPGATLNAASSLIVPIATLVFATGIRATERAWVPGMIVSLVAASMLLGLLQFSGAGLDNPLINGTIGEVSGSFANRNHFALFLALGCLVTPVWAVSAEDRLSWRLPVALGLLLVFLLTILASGSRSGIALGVIGLALGLELTRQRIRAVLVRYPRWVFPALIAAIVALIAVFVLISFAADRAVSIDRAFAIDAGRDMRSRGLPTVLAMIRIYFPFGSGLGGFDPIFRMHEPFELLELTYFNHAHNDLLEIVLDAGLPGLALLLCGITWWATAGVKVWRGGADGRTTMPKLGAAMLLLIIGASAVDYPARTPMFMAISVLAAWWLADGRHEADAGSGLTLPRENLPL